LPCRDCEFRTVDFGGCRCQAALITGQADVTDPACSLSPYREELARFVESVQGKDPAAGPRELEFAELAYRQTPAQRE